MKKADLEIYGNSLIGKKAQSGLLTHIGENGNAVLNDPEEITGFEIREWLKEPVLILTIGEAQVWEEYVINIH